MRKLAGTHWRLVLAVLMVSSLPAWAQITQQTITTVPAGSTVGSNSSFSFDVNYAPTPANSKSTGIGLRIHWNSNEVSPDSLTNVLTNDFFLADCTDPITDGTCSSPSPQIDSNNFDRDVATDRFIIISWVDFSPPDEFPAGTDPVRLFTANFTSTTNFTGGEITNIRFSTSGTPPGAVFSSTPHILSHQIATVVAVTASDPFAAEAGADTGTFTFIRTGHTSAPLTATYSIAGTATNGTDYATLSGTVNFAANSVSTTLTLSPVDDATAESTESVIVTIKAGAGYGVGTPSSAMVTIADDDSRWEQATQQTITPAPTASAVRSSSPFSFEVNYTAIPANSKSIGLLLRIHWNSNEVSLASLTNVLTIDLLVAECAGITADGTCLSPIPQPDIRNLDGDATTDRSIGIGWLSFTATFPASTEPVRLFNANFTSTANFGPAEVTYIRFTGGSTTPGISFTSTPHTVTTADISAVLTVAATDPTAAEAGADEGSFTFTRSGDTSAALTITYSLAGTATNGTDYATLSGIVNIAAGSDSATVSVCPVDDTVVEPDETVVVTITPVVGSYGAGVPSTATVTIADNDFPISSFTCPTGLAAGGPAGTGTVTLTTPASAGGTVVMLSSSAPEVASVPTSVTVPAGSTSVSFTVTPGVVRGSATITATFNGSNRTCLVSTGNTLSAQPGIPIPTLSGFGLSILIVLLAGVGVFLMSKMKM